jgi:ketosteroid isomerase-like protein
MQLSPRLAQLALICAVFVSCRQTPDLDSLRAEILELHRSFIHAHLAKDAASIARPTSPDYLSVANGTVTQMDAQQVEEMLSGYLDATEFSVYRDVEDPIIGISRDGSVAWTVVQVRVGGTSSMPDGSEQAFDTVWAWISLYQRDGDRWLRMVDVSTNRPFDEDAERAAATSDQP